MNDYYSIRDLNNIIMSTFKVGDVIIIKHGIRAWSSKLNGNYAYLCLSLKYPYKLTIKEIFYDSENNVVSMTEGEFGWSLTALVRENAVDMLSFARSEKLKRLEEVCGHE